MCTFPINALLLNFEKSRNKVKNIIFDILFIITVGIIDLDIYQMRGCILYGSITILRKENGLFTL